MQIDLTGADVVDAHCHPFRTQDLLDRDPRTFETRCMFLGTALLSSGWGLAGLSAAGSSAAKARTKRSKARKSS